MAELHLYDFDSTLFRSPHPPAVWDGGWWGDARSLTLPCVPDRPGDSWWIMPTVNRAKKSIADPNVFAVMMTGRRDNSAFRYRVPDLLRQRGLDFDAVHLDPGGPDSIKINKLRRVLQYLQRYPQIDTVRAWDDRKSHLQDFGKVLRHFGYRFFPHHVTERSRPSGCEDLKHISTTALLNHTTQWRRRKTLTNPTKIAESEPWRKRPCCAETVRSERSTLEDSVRAQMNIEQAAKEEVLMRALVEMYDNMDRLSEVIAQGRDPADMICAIQRRTAEIAKGDFGWELIVDRSQYARPGLVNRDGKIVLRPTGRGLYASTPR